MRRLHLQPHAVPSGGCPHEGAESLPIDRMGRDRRDERRGPAKMTEGLIHRLQGFRFRLDDDSSRANGATALGHAVGRRGTSLRRDRTDRTPRVWCCRGVYRRSSLSGSAARIHRSSGDPWIVLRRRLTTAIAPSTRSRSSPSSSASSSLRETPCLRPYSWAAAAAAGPRRRSLRAPGVGRDRSRGRK